MGVGGDDSSRVVVDVEHLRRVPAEVVQGREVQI